MKINEFKENNETKKEVMDQKMEALKLENINSTIVSVSISGHCRYP